MNKKLISRLLLFALIFSISSGSVFAAGEDLADETIAEISEQDEEDAEEEFAAPADDGVSDNYIANDETEPDEEGSDGSAEKTDDDVDSGDDSNDDPKDEFRTVILCKKVDLNSFFGEYKGEKKYELSNKKIGTVNKKGILTIKKAGDLDVYCFVKENGKWTKVDETYFAVDIPKAKMKTIPAGVVYREYQTLDLFKYITGNWGLEPGAWMIKADPEVATLDIKTGELRAGRKNGKAVVYAEYPFTFYGEYGKDPYARQIKFTIKIDHKKISIADYFDIPGGVKTRYTVSDKKIATVSKKGVISFKKEGGVTVNVQFKEGKNWVYKDTKACLYTLKKYSDVYYIDPGIPEKDMDTEGSYTSKQDVSDFIFRYERLPKNFITKKEAEALGWTGGGLDAYDNGKCIGGDYFGNHEGLLPEGDYRECDIDTLHKKSRGAKRLVYDVHDGDIYYTSDHYKTFIQIY